MSHEQTYRMGQGRTSDHPVDLAFECCSSTHSVRSQTTGFARCCCELSFVPYDLDQNRRSHCSKVKRGYRFHSRYPLTYPHWPQEVTEPSWLDPCWQTPGREQSDDRPCSPEWGFSAFSCCLCFQTRRTHPVPMISVNRPVLGLDVDFDSDFVPDQKRLAVEDLNLETSILEILHSAVQLQARLRLHFLAPRPSRTRVSRPPGLVRVSPKLFAERRLSHEGPPLPCLQRRKRSAKLEVWEGNGWCRLRRSTIESAGCVEGEAESDDRDRRGKVCQGPS